MTRLRRAALAVLVPLAAGCFTVDGVLRADGSGTVELTYPPAKHATIDSETARFTSPHVKVQSVEPQPGGVRIRAEFDDVTRLSTAEGLRMVTVVRGRRGRREALKLVIRNPEPQPFEDRGEPWPRIALTLPGRVVAATPQAEIAGDRVTWKLPIATYVTRPRTAVSVRWTRDARITY
jgi:hypothetical protein